MCDRAVVGADAIRHIPLTPALSRKGRGGKVCPDAVLAPAVQEHQREHEVTGVGSVTSHHMPKIAPAAYLPHVGVSTPPGVR